MSSAARILFLCALSLCSFPLWASEPERVVIAALEDSHLAKLVEAELRALNFDVVRSQFVFEAATPNQLERIARDAKAVAAIALTDEGHGKITIWIADRVTGKTTLRTLDTTSLNADEQVSVVALKTVELLRVSLAEMALPPESEPAAKDDMPIVVKVLDPGPAVQELVDATRPPIQPLHNKPRWRASLWGGVELSALELGAVPRLDVGWARTLVDELDLIAHAALPLMRTEVQQGDARVDFWTGTAALGVSWWVWRDGAWSLPLDIRLGIAWTHFQGHAAFPLKGHTDTLVGPLFEAHFGARRQFGEHLALRFGLSAGTLGVAHTIDIAAGNGVRWGDLLGRVNFGLEVGWGQD